MDASDFYAATAAGNTRVASTVAKIAKALKNGIITANVKSLSGKNAAAARALFCIALKQGATLPSSVSESDAQKINDEMQRLDGRALRSLSVVLKGSTLCAWHNSHAVLVDMEKIDGATTAKELSANLGLGDGDMITFDITAPEGEVLAPLMHNRAPSRVIGNMAFVYVAPNSTVALAKPKKSKPAANKPAANKPATNKPAAGKPAAVKPAANRKPVVERESAAEPTVEISATIRKAIDAAVKKMRSHVDEYPGKLAVTGEGLCGKKDETTDVRMLVAAIALQKNPKGFMMVLKKRCGAQAYARLEKFVAAIGQADMTGVFAGQRRTSPDIRLSILLNKGFKITLRD